MIVTRQPPPSEQEIEIARTLKQSISENQPLTVQELPASVVALLVDILGALADERGVTVVTDDVELTTEQAAELLNVSRPYVIKLLEEGQMPHRKVGVYRRVKLQDVLTYKRESDKQSNAIMDQLVAEAQAQGRYK